MNDEFTPEPQTDDEPRDEERISKLIARAGIASRRAAEAIIEEGRVAVNGHFVREPGAKADPARDRITVDGKRLKVTEKAPTVVLLHKPRHTITTRSDPQGRPTVFDLLPRGMATLFPIGRLDFDTSGVLLLTDDGELAHLLTHPSHGAWKSYEARVRGEVKLDTVRILQRGVMLEDGMTAPALVRVLAQREKNALVLITLREGRNRQVRRMLEIVGHPVSSLRRVAFAGVELEGLKAGEHRVLLPGEIKALRKRVEKKVGKPRQAPQKSKTTAQKPRARPKTSAEASEAREARAKSKTPAKSAVARRVEEKWR